MICKSGILALLFIVLIQPQKLITTNKLDLNIPKASHYCEKCSICLWQQGWRRHAIYAILKQKPCNFSTITQNAYLRTQSCSLSALRVYDQQDSYKCSKATRMTAKHKSVRQRKCHFFSFLLVKTTKFNNDISKIVQVLTVILSRN